MHSAADALALMSAAAAFLSDGTVQASALKAASEAVRENSGVVLTAAKQAAAVATTAAFTEAAVALCAAATAFWEVAQPSQ